MNCLCVFQHSASPPREEKVTAVQPCQIYCIAKFFQESGWRVKLYWILVSGDVAQEGFLQPFWGRHSGAMFWENTW